MRTLVLASALLLGSHYAHADVGQLEMEYIIGMAENCGRGAGMVEKTFGTSTVKVRLDFLEYAMRKGVREHELGSIRASWDAGMRKAEGFDLSGKDPDKIEKVKQEVIGYLGDCAAPDKALENSDTNVD